jgi:hypothetical protein
VLSGTRTDAAPRTSAAGNRAARGKSTCNTLVSDAPSVTSTTSSAKVPTAAGGAIADGTYVLTSMTVYSALPIPGMTLSSLLQITGTTIQQVATVNGEEKRFTTSFSPAGASLAMMDICPTPKSGNYTFTATPTELRMYLSSPVGKIEQTYAKR